MIVRSPRPSSHFTILNNSLINDPRLSFRAMGILVYILSKPDNWRTSVQQLSKSRQNADSGSVRGSGAKAVRSALSELTEAGYVRTERTHKVNGEWTFRYLVSDRPLIEREPWPDNPDTVNNPVDKVALYPPPHDRKGDHRNGHVNKELNLQRNSLSVTVSKGATITLCPTCHGTTRTIQNDTPTICHTCNGGGTIKNHQ